MKKNLIYMGILIILTACSNQRAIQQKDKIYEVHARFDTPPSKDGKDHVDDPAIYVNAKNPDKSFVIATNKSKVGGGLHIYDLEGKELGYIADGRMNNVDIRYGFQMGQEKIDIAVATHRSKNSLAIYKIDPEKRTLINIPIQFQAVNLETKAKLSERTLVREYNDVLQFSKIHSLKEDGYITGKRIDLGFSPYGGCLYHNPNTNKFYFFATSKKGKLKQIELFDNGNEKIGAKIVRTLNVGSISEGCVADDEKGVLFVGEENVAIWKYNAEPTGGDTRSEVAVVGQHLVDDIEGLAIYKQKDGAGYLIASSQGNSTYVIFDRKAPHIYKGTFRITPKGSLEGTEQTDGIAVTSNSLPHYYPNGLFVAHDNRSRKGGGSNFKFVSWRDIKNVVLKK